MAHAVAAVHAHLNLGRLAEAGIRTYEADVRPEDAYRPGGAQKSYDKQYLRDYLLAIEWNQKPPAPDLPEEVVRNTRAKYLEALHHLTGRRYDFS